MGLTRLKTLEKIDAVRAWINVDLGKLLEEDPSGFLAGAQSVSVVEALDEIEAAIRGDGSLLAAERVDALESLIRGIHADVETLLERS